MTASSRLLAALIVASAVTGPALAQEAGTMQVKDCGVFCKVWRNFSGKAQVSFSGPIPNEVMHDPPPPPADEGTELPDPKRLVKVHGTIIPETAAERRRREKQFADLMKETERPPGEMDAATKLGAMPK